MRFSLVAIIVAQAIAVSAFGEQCDYGIALADGLSCEGSYSYCVCQLSTFHPSPLSTQRSKDTAANPRTAQAAAIPLTQGLMTMESKHVMEAGSYAATIKQFLDDTLQAVRMSKAFEPEDEQTRPALILPERGVDRPRVLLPPTAASECQLDALGSLPSLASRGEMEIRGLLVASRATSVEPLMVCRLLSAVRRALLRTGSGRET
ncbi:unnamed protein product [Diplocarpon coronariae]